MDSPYDEERRENHSYKTRESEESSVTGKALEANLADLVKTKEEVKRAKDSTMQSWLDSRPLIDELERLKSGLASAQNRSSMSNVVISELESELESTNNGIRSEKEEEHKARKIINKINQALDQTHKELERLKLDTDEERRARSKLKQALRLKKQTLRTLQFTLRAVRIESVAFGASAAEALRHINNSEMDNTTVQLTQEDYYALTRRAKEETQLADWRISVSMEQKTAAEASRNLALIRLKESHSGNRSRRRRMKEEKMLGDGHTKEEAEEQDSNTRAGAPVNNRGLAFPKARAKLIAESVPQQQLRRSKSNHNETMIPKMKTSSSDQIRSVFVRSITRLFG